MGFVADLKQTWNVKELRVPLIAIAIFAISAFYVLIFIYLKDIGVINTPFFLEVSGYVGGTAAILTILIYVIKISMEVGKVFTEFGYVKRDVKDHTRELHGINIRLNIIETDVNLIKKDITYIKHDLTRINKQLDILVSRA